MKRLKIKKLDPDAVIPFFATEGSAGMDLTAISHERDSFGCHVYGTGLAFEIPDGHVGLLFSRSSIRKKGLTLTNCVGVLDSDYRGDIKFVFRELGEGDIYEIGDRVGQLVIVELPKVAIEEVEELSETVRGVGGFGSTGF